MKKLIAITKLTLVFFMSMLLSIGIWSCSEDDETVNLSTPNITSITPGTGFVGDEVTISGTNFSTAASLNSISFNGITTPAIKATAVELTAIVPVGATTGDVVVTTNSIASNGVSFIVKDPIIPSITSINPTSGRAGDTIRITGTDFSPITSNNIVSFNGAIATVNASTETEIVTTVPATASTGSVSVIVNNQQSNGVQFEFTGGAVNSLTVEIIASEDDAEEGALNGKLSTTSSDLELGEYDTWTQDGIEQGVQTIGLRFNDIAIPQSANVLEAYIQFTCDNTGADPVQLTIYGENSANAITFSEDIFYDITSRPKTSASVVWDIPEWVNEGDAGDAQKTLNLASIVQEIVNKGDWASGNSVVFILEPSGPSIGVTSSSGGREAETFDGTAVSVLTVIYE